MHTNTNLGQRLLPNTGLLRFLLFDSVSKWNDVFQKFFSTLQSCLRLAPLLTYRLPSLPSDSSLALLLLHILSYYLTLFKA